MGPRTLPVVELLSITQMISEIKVGLTSHNTFLTSLSVDLNNFLLWCTLEVHGLEASLDE